MLWAKDVRQEILQVNPEMGKLMSCILVQHRITGFMDVVHHLEGITNS
jgi:hypothetical protein